MEWKGGLNRRGEIQLNSNLVDIRIFLYFKTNQFSLNFDKISKVILQRSESTDFGKFKPL